jgi:hypothetical protein
MYSTCLISYRSDTVGAMGYAASRPKSSEAPTRPILLASSGPVEANMARKSGKANNPAMSDPSYPELIVEQYPVGGTLDQSHRLSTREWR